MEECPICKDDKELIILNCGHKFCNECITTWLKKSSTCPMCRRVIDNEFECIFDEKFINDCIKEYIIKYKQGNVMITEEIIDYKKLCDSYTDTAAWKSIYEPVIFRSMYNDLLSKLDRIIYTKNVNEYIYNKCESKRDSMIRHIWNINKSYQCYIYLDMFPNGKLYTDLMEHVPYMFKNMCMYKFNEQMLMNIITTRKIGVNIKDNPTTTFVNLYLEKKEKKGFFSWFNSCCYDREGY